MFKVVDKQTPATRKLVLGFDAGCGTCSDLAGRVQERVGDKLSVENLNDPKLMSWREEALGKDAKWAPTLFEVDGDKVVRAWTGWKMGWALSRKLGPATTWQVMQALGEVGAAPRIEESSLVEKLPERAAEAVAGMSRGQFLKGIGGAAVAMSVLSGTNLLASPAAAATGPFDVVGSTPIKGLALTRLARKRARSRDVKNVSGLALSSTAKVDRTKKHGFREQLRNGTSVTTVMYMISKQRLIMHSQYSNPVKGISASIAHVTVMEFKAGERVTSTIVKVSEGGSLWRRTTNISAQGGIQPLSECPPVGGGSTVAPPPSGCRSRLKKFCLQWEDNFGCILGAGAKLGLSCGGCTAGALTTPTPAGLGRQILAGGSLAYACGECSTPLRKFDGCSRCLATQTVRVYDCS